MSALSVMDRLLECVSVGVDADDPMLQLIEAGHEARAAIAELIEASSSYLELPTIEAANRLSAALARVGGGK